MRIGILSPQYMSSHWSGMGRSTSAIAKGLAASGVEVILYTARPGTRDVFYNDGGVQVRSIGYGNTELKNLIYEEAPVWNNRIVADFQRRPFQLDMILLQDWFGLSAAHVMAARTGAILNLWIRTFSNGQGGYVPFNGMELAAMYRQDETMAVKSVAGRLCGFSRIVRDVQLYTGLEVKTVKCGSAPFLHREHNKSGKNNGNVLMAGKISREKGYERIIRALPHMPWATLYIAGSGGGSNYGGYLQRLVKQMDVADRVNFTGWMSAMDLCELYHNAEMVVCPNLFDGFGYSLFDAQNYGVPVIGYSVSYSDYIEDGINGMTFQSSTELVEKMEMVHGSPILKSRLIKNGMESMVSEETMVAGILQAVGKEANYVGA